MDVSYGEDFMALFQAGKSGQYAFVHKEAARKAINGLADNTGARCAAYFM